MSKVRAQLISTQHQFSAAVEITRVDYTPRKLNISLHGKFNEPSLIVEFEYVVGFRVLDEGDLNEYWPVCSSQNGWLFEVTSDGWLTQEQNRSGGLITAMNPEVKEYFIAGENECVSILSRSSPVVHSNAL